MSFLFTTEWGAMWLVLLCISGAYVWRRNTETSSRILAVMVANWLGTRSIVTFADSGDYAMLGLDAATSIAMAWYGRSTAALSIAAMFFIITLFDSAQALNIATFSQVGAVSDALGVLMLVIMIGASHGDTGKLARTHRRGVTRRSYIFGSVAFRRETE